MENIDNVDLNEKTINNAKITYFFIFFSWLLLFNKIDKNINNSFVKSHVKSSSIIHLWFIITYVIFVSYSLFSSFNILWFPLNHIIAACIFTWLLWVLILWMYKASKKQIFVNSDIKIFIKNENLIDINKDEKINEKDKLTILLSYIPFLGFLIFPKNKEKELIQNITKLNLIIIVIIMSLYIFWNTNLSTLIVLIYTIYVVFIWLNLFIKNEIININLSKIPSFEELIIIIKSLKIYLFSYFKDKDFDNLGKIINTVEQEYKIEQESEQKNLEVLKDLKIPKFLVYVPIFNLIFIFIRNSKYKYHIINWITITFILILIIILKHLNYVNSNIYLLIIIPITFGMWYIKHYLPYKMPFIYQTYELINKIKNILIFKSKKINEKRKEVNEVSFKVWEKIEENLDIIQEEK